MFENFDCCSSYLESSNFQHEGWIKYLWYERLMIEVKCQLMICREKIRGLEGTFQNVCN